MDKADESPARGTKRKYADDGTETIGFSNKLSIIEDPSNNSSPAETPDASESLVVLRDDEYFKSLYTEETDFGLLGRRDPEFQAVLQHGSLLDFSDPAAVMQLTKTLLKVDFGLRVELPTDRLCPPVPNRHNYILWLKDLIDSSGPSYLEAYDPARRVVGLDIGTGASLIYPLLGCAQRSAWSFVATDVDTKSLSNARANAVLNGLEPRIRVVGRRDAVADPLIPLDELGIEKLDFTMTNPPFYTSAAELADLAASKRRPPNSACTGAPVEMVCAGGEVGFVRRIVRESLALHERVQWYTAMLGKQASLDVLIADLRGHGVTNYAVTAFVQGNRTRRWAIGWSFGARRPSLSASRGCEPLGGKSLLPWPTEQTIWAWSAAETGSERLGQVVCDAMQALDLVSWSWDESRSRGLGFSDGNVWSRAYRRKKARDAIDVQHSGADGRSPATQKPREKCAFGFSVTIRTDKDNATAVLRWLQGNDHVLFESFAGFLRNFVRTESE
ncbi:hypothetical protein F4821DRAFT_103611 [Hypoxylon rubiginosum]|uniref:Uncharacterized protein n=1 Tax=Hypoxylon rubiginosum TaxID=110542 RepID=A0ACC0D4Q7_9PEZI|nr:hypothetical protein F4821DRAFT_103611 [Hypoxylon rubiginosum]